jgi:hypothetical protein
MPAHRRRPLFGPGWNGRRSGHTACACCGGDYFRSYCHSSEIATFHVSLVTYRTNTTRSFSSLSERLVARPSLGDLRHLFAATLRLQRYQSRTSREARRVSLALIPTDQETRGKWLEALSRLAEDEPDVCDKIVSAIDPRMAGSLVLDPSLSDLTISESIARARLALKIRLVRIWTANDPAVCNAELERNAQVDFNFIILAGFNREPLGHVPTESRPLRPADEWLDAITVAAPADYPLRRRHVKDGSVDSRSERRCDDRDTRYTLVRWFRRRQIETRDETWAAARERIQAAADEDDLETAAGIGALELPGDVAKLREFRELVVREISLAKTRGRNVSHLHAISRLRTVLERDASDLAKF